VDSFQVALVFPEVYVVVEIVTLISDSQRQSLQFT